MTPDEKLLATVFGPTFELHYSDVLNASMECEDLEKATHVAVYKIKSGQIFVYPVVLDKFGNVTEYYNGDWFDVYGDDSGFEIIGTAKEARALAYKMMED